MWSLQSWIAPLQRWTCTTSSNCKSFRLRRLRMTSRTGPVHLWRFFHHSLQLKAGPCSSGFNDSCLYWNGQATLQYVKFLKPLLEWTFVLARECKQHNFHLLEFGMWNSKGCFPIREKLKVTKRIQCLVPRSQIRPHQAFPRHTTARPLYVHAYRMNSINNSLYSLASKFNSNVS